MTGIGKVLLSPHSGRFSALTRHLLIVGAVLAGISLHCTVPSQAQSVWGGTGSSTATADYNAGSNWSSLPAGAPPVAGGQSAFFGDTGSATVTVGPGPYTPDSWTFGANAQDYTISGGAINFRTGLTSNASAGQAISIGNQMSGSLLLQAGSGALTLSGSNTFTTTSVSAGTLVNSGVLTSAVTNSGTLNNSGTLTGSLSNTGTVNVTGGALNGVVSNNSGGTFNVTGTATSNDTFTNAAGATTTIGAGGSYTAATLSSNSGALTIEAGGTVGVTGGSQIFVNRDGAMTVNGTLSARLLQVSGGTVFMNASNATTVNFTSGGAGSPILDISGAGGAVSLTGVRSAVVSGVPVAGAIKLGANTLVIANNALSGNYVGTIEGTGGVTVGLNGVLALGAGTVGTYTGATTVGAGTLLIRGQNAIATSSGVFMTDPTSSLSVQANNAIKTLQGVSGSQIELITNLTFTNASTVYDGIIYDPSDTLAIASVTMAGGHQTLGGNNSYYGLTTVNGGTLTINGSIALSSMTTVNSGGTLGGIGTVGNTTIAAGGTLAPGNYIGTLTVQGNAAFAAGSTFAVEVAAPNQADRVAVTGTATINGGAVQVSKLSPETSYQSGQTYRILDAGTLVRNADFTLTNPFLFLSSGLVYGANSVDLLLSARAAGQGFSTVATTDNQSQAATALNGLQQTGDALAVYNELLVLTDANEACRAYELSSGESHATGQYVLDQTFDLFSNAMGHRQSRGTSGSSGREGGTAPLGYAAATPSGPGIVAIEDAMASPQDAHPASAWLTPLGGRGMVGGSANAGKLEWWAAGLAGGLEQQINLGNDSAYMGVGLGYIRSGGRVDARLSSMSADAFNVGTYGGWTQGPWSLAGALAYSANSISTERQIVFGGINRTARAGYWAHAIGFSGEAAYGVDLTEDTTVSPLFTLDAGWSGHAGFTETGAGALNLTAAGENALHLDGGLGLAVSHVMRTETGEVTVDGRLLWQHALVNTSPSQALAFAGSPTAFTVSAPDAGRDRLQLGLGLTLEPVENTTIRAGYSGLFSGNQHSHSANLDLAVRF